MAAGEKLSLLGTAALVATGVLSPAADSPALLKLNGSLGAAAAAAAAGAAAAAAAAAAAGICRGDEGLSGTRDRRPLLRLEVGVAYVVRTLLRPLPDAFWPVLLLSSVASLRHAWLLPALVLPGVTCRRAPAEPDPPPEPPGVNLLMVLAAVAPGDTQCSPALAPPLPLTAGVAKADMPLSALLPAGVAPRPDAPAATRDGVPSAALGVRAAAAAAAAVVATPKRAPPLTLGAAVRDSGSRSYLLSLLPSLPYSSSSPSLSRLSPQRPRVLPAWCSASVLMIPSCSICCRRPVMRARRLTSVSCCACMTLYSSSTCPLMAAAAGAAGEGAGDLPAPHAADAVLPGTTLGPYQGLVLVLRAFRPPGLNLLPGVVLPPTPPGRGLLKMLPPARARCCCCCAALCRWSCCCFHSSSCCSMPSMFVLMALKESWMLSLRAARAGSRGSSASMAPMPWEPGWNRARAACCRLTSSQLSTSCAAACFCCLSVRDIP